MRIGQGSGPHPHLGAPIWVRGQAAERLHDRVQPALGDRQASAVGADLIGQHIATRRHHRQAGPEVVEEARPVGKPGLDVLGVEADPNVGVA